MRAIGLLLLLPSLAFGQGLSTLAPGQTGQKRTNWITHSNDMATGPVATSPWTAFNVTVNSSPVAPAGAGGGTWAKLTSTAAVCAYYVPSASSPVPSGTKFVGSFWVAKESGTGYATVISGCAAGTATGCACWRSDGGTITPTTSAGDCLCDSDGTIGTTPVRMAALLTCSTANTAVQLNVNPGQRAVAVGTSLVAGAQIEASAATKPSNLCVTTTAAKTCK